MSIRDDFFTAQAKASLWDVAVSIKRGNPLPLDANSVFKAYGVVDTDSYAGSLLEYASSNPVAYPGQICAVVEENATTIYYLDQNLAIQKVGIIPTSGDNAILVTPTGEISLSGFTAAADNTVAMKNEAGALVWKTLEEIGDGNDNTTYEFAFADQKITITPKFNDQPIMEGEGEEAKQVKYELDLSTFVTEAELADALRTLPTYSVKEGDKVLKLEGTEFSTVVSLNYVPAVAADEEAGVQAAPAKIQLLGIGDVVIDEIDATPFIKDGMLNSVDYDPDTKNLTFFWNTDAGIQAETVPLASFVDTYTAGNGLDLANNQFSVKIDTASENFLTVGEAGLKLAGVADAISAAEGRAATDAATKAGTAKSEALASVAENYYNKTEVYTKGETDNKIDAKIASVTGGESAADVKSALESYRDAINTEIFGADAANWTTTVEEDGKTKVIYTPQYGTPSRIDTLADKVQALENVGAQANVIEAVVGAADNRLSITTSGKTVTIDDANLRTDIGNAKKAGDDAAAAAEVNAKAITGHDKRIGDLETAKAGFDTSIAALLEADQTANGKILALETTVDNPTSGVAATYAIASKNKSDIAALLAKDEALDKDIADLKAADLTINGSLTTINATLENVYLKTEVYNKTEIDGKVNTINGELAKKLESTDLADYAKTADVVLKSVYEQHVADANAAIEANADNLAILLGSDVDENGKASASVRQIAEAVAKAEIGSAGHLKREIVTKLPAIEDADADTIYMVKGGTPASAIYTTEVRMDSQWELINGTYEQVAPGDQGLGSAIIHSGDEEEPHRLAPGVYYASIVSPNELDIKYALKEVIRVDVELSNGDIIPLDANGYFTLEGDLPIVADVLLFNTEGEAEGAPELTLYRLNESTNVYKEYMLVNGVFEQIGDTAVNLDGYATEDYVDNSIAPLIAQLQGINNSTVIDVINQKITEKLTIANDTTPGVVLSAKDVDSEPVANSVYVGETGLMTVKKITTDILENGENELILFGGKA